MQQTKYLQLWKEVAEHMHKIILIILHMFSATSWTLNLRFKIECSIATSFTKRARVNITSCSKPFESSPKKSKEEHERGSEEPKDGNYQSTDCFFRESALPREQPSTNSREKNTDFGELAQKLQSLLKI